MTRLLPPKTSFTFLSDPGHGWLIVTPQWVDAVGLSITGFSRYSYVSKDGTLALEEDWDATIFLDAYKRVFGSSFAVHDAFQPDAEVRRWRSVRQSAA